MNRSALAYRLWLLSQRGSARRFAQALHQPALAQQAMLRQTLRANADSVFGKRHGFDVIDSAEEYRRRVPLCTYDDLADDIDRIRRGEPNILTAEPVTRLIPTSGSTSAVKLIPYTSGLQRQFNRAIGPWMVDLFNQHPTLMHGPAYWSISPAIDLPRRADDAVPVGFDDDSSYLGTVGRWLIGSTMAVPSDVRRLADIDDFRYATLWWLLRARGLRLVSVWHPSFWSLLTDALPRWWGALRDDLAHGVCSLPSGRACRFARARPVHLPHDTVPKGIHTLWPELTVVSAWADAAAAQPYAALQDAWPGVAFQPKGVLSTEGFMSIPWRGGYPAAVCSHVIELLGNDGRCVGLAEAEVDGCYEPVLTTAGGLYRYRTGDLVEVTGRVAQTPTLRLLGRTDRVHDLCGEKLSERLVEQSIEAVFEAHQLQPTFVMLAPADTSVPTGYELFLGLAEPTDQAVLLRVRDEVEQRFCTNPHYAYALRLGQLLPLRVVRVGSDAHPLFLRRMQAEGYTAGGVKPTLISPLSKWVGCFAPE